MGRHSRRGPAPKGDAADTSDIGAKRKAEPRQGGREGTAQVPRPARGEPSESPRRPDGTPAPGFPRPQDGTPARGMPRAQDGTSPPGMFRRTQGRPVQGVPGFPDGTPAHGVPRLPDGTPAHGVPRFPDGTPAHGVPRVRGGHPEQREAGGGWGETGGASGGTVSGPAGQSVPRQRRGGPGGPRQEYVDAFAEDVDVFTPPRPGRGTGFGGRRAAEHPPSAGPSVTALGSVPHASPLTSAPPHDGGDDGAPPAGDTPQPKGGKGRALTGVAAAAVTTVLAVVVAGQVADSGDGSVRSPSAAGDVRITDGSASRGNGRTTPSVSAPPRVATLSYEQAMDRKYPLGAGLTGSGKFDAVPGSAKAPGTGRKYTYRVDVERGLGLDGELFAAAVQKTLNDDRSWAHGGARTFERVHSGDPDFVITLASPGTTAKWCAKSGLDTTEDNVSCDSAATERVMINAYRWAQGSRTYGDKIHAYRQMLINHEVGHRLGHGHVTCEKDGELAPVMQQQTKFLDHDGIHCLPNAWPYPRS
ncbi:DUF3152 domain-containing protein [Streptomyces sp. NPDC093970]|uniref:DUF3152 domain-containing protein n=1 Tax=Streptomyces sp. NPDC093970 TaxID=3155076 RepID=UPI003436B7B9